MALVGAYLYASGVITIPAAGAIGTGKLSVVVEYADGETVTYPRPFDIRDLLPGTIIDPGNGKELKKITWTLTCKGTWTGGVASATALTGDVKVYLMNPMEDPILKKTTPISYTTLMVSGTEYTILTGSLTAAEIEGYNTLPGGRAIKVQADTTLKVTLPGVGTPIQRNGSANFVYSYTVSPPTITGIDLDISPVLTYV